MLSEPVLHLSFCKSHAIAASKTARLTRLQNNWSKKTQAKVFRIIEDPLPVATVSSAAFLIADENDWKVLKFLSSLGVEGYLGLSQQLLQWSCSSGSWFHDCLQEMGTLPRMSHLGNLLRVCTALLLMDGCHKESYSGVNYHHNWILPCSDKGRGLLGFHSCCSIWHCKGSHPLQSYLSMFNYYGLKKHTLYSDISLSQHSLLG